MTMPKGITAQEVGGRQAPFVIALPRGVGVSGVATWALRTSAGLAAAGRPVGLIVHRTTAGHSAVAAAIPDRVRVFDASALPDIDSVNGDLSAFIPFYARVCRTLAAEAKRPVVISPNLLGDCYGIAAALTMADGELLRIVGYQHSPIPYDSTVLRHYAPAITRFVGVSTAVAADLRAGLGEGAGGRAADVRHVAHGVEPAEKLPDRPPARARPLRILYTGRLENDLKRVGALVELSRELTRRGIDHRLTLVGDGPATDEIERACRGDPEGRITRREPVPPEHVARLLDENDIFVLASRAEGLSVSLLEAMARGCVPVVTRTRSGADQTIDEGVSGEFAAPGTEDEPDFARVGAALADAVARALDRGLENLARGAWEAVRRKFSLAQSVERTATLIEECAAAAPRFWPASRPAAFTAPADSPGGSGAVPPDGAAKLRLTLSRLAGQSIVIHGTGRHTLELGAAIAEAPARIVAFADDDPARVGRAVWGWPIVKPADAGKTGATHVVISSWMNQDAIWSRRAIYERQGMTVHRVYE